MRVVTIEQWPSPVPTDYRPELETGNILFFPITPFPLPEESQEFLRGRGFSGGAVHKNIAYRPALDKVTGIEEDPANSEKLRAIMRDYSNAVVKFTSELFPEYARAWKLDYASFRPLEEQGRDLPLNKRNDLIHTDAFPSRPTNGSLILRVFTNIHPSKSRNWITTDPFAVIAEQHARAAGLDQIATGGRLLNRSARILKSVGVPVVPRSPYDRFMLHFHEYLKRNTDFQANCPKYPFEFPAGSTWLVFTDVVPHSVHSGQHALEQTFIISQSSLSNSANAPAAVLERLCSRNLLET